MQSFVDLGQYDVADTKAKAVDVLYDMYKFPADQRVIAFDTETTGLNCISAKLLGISETVTSPTFVILKKYKLGDKILEGKFSFFIHIDAYRLKSGKELQALGWQEIISDSKNLVFIEFRKHALMQNLVVSKNY